MASGQAAEEHFGRAGRLSLLVVEALIALVLIIAVVLAAAGAVEQLLSTLTEGVNADSARASVVLLLDLAVLMLLASDLLRTVVTSIREGRVPLRSIIEVGGLVIVREMIASSIESFSTTSVLVLAAALAVVIGAYVLLRRYVPE